MNITIFPQEKLHGVVIAPPSKSITHRAIICAALAQGVSTIDNILISDDTERTIDACKALGVKITQRKNQLTIVGSGGVLKAPKHKIDVGESGTTFRFVTAMTILTAGNVQIIGQKRLLDRPIEELHEALKKINEGFVKISGNTSSQFISALLLIAPCLKQGLEIEITGDMVSKKYVEVTMDVMKYFGASVIKTKNGYKVTGGSCYKSHSFTVEGDYSSASYFAAAAAITKGDLRIKGLNVKSKQVDRIFFDILEKMGCEIVYGTDDIRIINKSTLRGVEVDMSGCPDIAPTLAAVALFAKTPTKIIKIGHLRLKESDRIDSIKTELMRMGGKIEVGQDYIVIHSSSLRGATIDPHNDHRIVMMAAIAGLGAIGETTIKHAEVVKKSYPGFFKDLDSLHS